MTLGVLGGSYKSWIENQVRLRAQLLKYKGLYTSEKVTSNESHRK